MTPHATPPHVPRSVLKILDYHRSHPTTLNSERESKAHNMPPKENHVAQTLLARAHSPSSATRIYTEKVQQRPLHLKPTTSAGPNAQTQRRVERERKLAARKKKLKPKPLSSRQKRSLGLYDIPKSAQKYAVYAPLHQMWLGYIREVLGIDEAGNGEHGMEVEIGSSEAARLCAADYHGAEVEVVRSRCVSRVGVKGIVVKDSKFVFEVVTGRDRVKIVPKEHTVFRFSIPRRGKQGAESVAEETKAVDGTSIENQLDERREAHGTGKEKAEARRDLIFELHGDQFMFRAADRANRKFKSHFLPDV